MAQFILKIDLGNDGLNCGYDIAETLSKISQYIYDHGCDPVNDPGATIRDRNGNTVGSWQVK